MSVSQGVSSRVYRLPLGWGESAWFGASFLLNVLSIASLIDILIARPSILSVGLSLYQCLVDKVFHSIPLIGPHYNPGSPAQFSLTQIFVLMGGVFCSTNFYCLRTEGMSVLHKLFDLSRFMGGTPFRITYTITRLICLYIFGPVIYSYLVYVAVTERAPYQRLFGLTFQPIKVLAYYSLLVFVISTALWVAAFIGI
jgi:hypothetical protein